MESNIEYEQPKYLVINPVFEGNSIIFSKQRFFSNEIDTKFLIKITRIKNIVHELYTINKNLNNPKVRKLI